MSVDASFVYLDIRLKDYLGARHHLGAGYLRAFLARHGIESEQYLAPPTKRLDRMADELAERRPTFVGFTVFDRNFHLTRLLAQKVRERLPRALIVAGGPTATFSYELLLGRCAAFDACVLHHGEEAALALLAPLRRGRAPMLAAVPRLAFRVGDRVSLSTARSAPRGGPREGALDRFPSPYLSGAIPPTLGDRVGVVTARGCPFRCSYCNFSAMSTGQVEYHSIARTVEELVAIDGALAGRRGRARLEFFDDVFTLNRSRTLALCAAIEAARLRHLTFWCETRADLVDEEVLEHLARAGVTEMNFGLESTDARVLTAIHKLRGGASRHAEFLSCVRRAVVAARAAGIAPFVSLIFGLPDETAETAHRTLDFIESLPLEGYSHNFLHVEPGTELWHTHARYGIDVTEGPQILPYRTTHAYDVHREVPVRPHRMSLERMTRSSHALRVAEALGGRLPPREHDEPLGFVCLSGAVTPEVFAATWWTSAVGPATAVALVSDGVGPADYDTWLSAAARHDLPLFRLDVARRDAGGLTLADDRPALQAPPEYRLRRVTPGQDGRDPDDVCSVLTFREVTTGAAPERAADWILELAEKDAAALGEMTLELSCRFAGRPCPAASYAAAWVDERGVRPCPPAPPREPRPLPILAGRAALNHAAEMARRGCANCEVQATCPKCIHTAPLQPAEYCQVQKRGKMLHAALVLEIARLLSRSESAPGAPAAGSLRLGRVLARGASLAASWKTTVLLVTAWQKTRPLLYDAAGARLWEVPEALALFLELAGHAETEQLPAAAALCRSLEHLGVARTPSAA